MLLLDSEVSRPGHSAFALEVTVRQIVASINTIAINGGGYGRVDIRLRVAGGGVRPDDGLSTVWLC